VPDRSVALDVGPAKVPSMRRAERRSWILLGMIVGVLVLFAVAILGYSYWADRRVEDCREREQPGSEAWANCAHSGDFNG
jgi:hypothetical protein